MSDSSPSMNGDEGEKVVSPKKCSLGHAGQASLFVNKVRQVFGQVDPIDLFLLLFLHPFTLVSAKKDLLIEDDMRRVEERVPLQARDPDEILGA